LLVFNDTFNNVLVITYNMVTSFISMFYVIPDTLLKVSLNTNKTGHHVLRYTWHIVESVAKHQKNWVTMFYAITNIVESGIKHQ
jgi:hypothetical protein